MAQTSRPDPANGRVITDDDYEQLATTYVADGVFGSPIDTAVVYADSTGRQVKVRAAKRAAVRGWLWKSDPTTDEIIASLPANTSGNPRIDRLVLRYDRATRLVRTQYLQGTAAATPAAPALTQGTGTSGLFDFPLARWTVANGYTTIAAADITNEAWYPQPSGLIQCKSSSRPFGVSVAYGQEIREQDTLRRLWWDGSAWRLQAGQVLYAKFTTNQTFYSNQPGGNVTIFSAPYINVEPNQSYLWEWKFFIGNGAFATGSCDSQINLATNGGPFAAGWRCGLTAINTSGQQWPTGRQVRWNASASDTSVAAQFFAIVNGGNSDCIASGAFAAEVRLITTGQLSSEVSA